MNTQQKPYVLPRELHLVLSAERISVSPIEEQPGREADFYAYVFDLCQEDTVNAFGATPTEAVANVLKLLDKPYVLAEADEPTFDAANAAIQFALRNGEGLQFLRHWNQGDFDVIRKEWPEVPEEVFIETDTSNKRTYTDRVWEHEKNFSDLVRAIWPSTPVTELSDKITLQHLQALIDSGSLATEHEVRLKSYLSSLPGYGMPGFEKETELHHGYVTISLHRSRAAS
ncbi:hypothetical protein [Pseudomonas fragariae (ex Marin et al. 2024)]|uniref:hypothetical protein n=1 Tax=Pseudomonas fragariae (ex Marin et al. 2024) TaxID=3080056 RepID=UPI002A24E57A|nr:hypothetical protein [Pseudomonas sp. 20]MDX9625917.1 hypothetical protein [Pseudomonas sp. 20]